LVALGRPGDVLTSWERPDLGLLISGMTVARRRYRDAMTLAEITRPSVDAALDEFDRLGRDAFLRDNGFGRARSYYIVRGDRLYDSKAIIGYAHGIETNEFLTGADFSGGASTVEARLRALGYEVRRLKSPDWTRDEIVLACALVEANGWRALDGNDPRVRELSELLQAPVIFPFEDRGLAFRNSAGVARKTADIATRHPLYSGAPTNGSYLDREVLADFLARPEEMRAKAAAIRAVFAEGELPPLVVSDVDLDEIAAEEGGVLLRQHLRRERNQQLRRAKIAAVRSAGLAIACEVCGFEFERVYGDRGRDYIECHHRTPLFSSGATKTTLHDLALICSNCHRMIHRTKTWLLPEQLKAIVDEHH
jgi:5-methylcytosine-specific restriction protein A